MAADRYAVFVQFSRHAGAAIGLLGGHELGADMRQEHHAFSLTAA